MKGNNIMRPQVFVFTLVLTAGMAVAQTAPANPQPQNGQKSGQTGASQPAGGAGSGTELPQMKTSAFKGILVDMSCAASATSSTSTAGSASAEAAPAKSANRSAADSGSNCAVSASSSSLGMKLDDGRTVRFDLVGNQRAAEALKNDKRWSKNLADGKPIHAKAIGALNGDKLIVASIQ
jgi:hypothetical protein